MTVPGTIPADAAERLVRRATGSAAVAWSELSHDHAVAAVYLVELEDGGRVVLKRSGTSDKHAREVRAYQRLAVDGVGDAPRLLAHDDEWRMLLLEHLPGRPDLPEDAPVAASVHAQAGRWLARLHRARRMADDPLPLDEVYRLRADRWTEAARGSVDEDDLAWLDDRLQEALPAMAERPRVPCHRDFHARNWLVAGDRLSGVIDFEHARDDLAEIDLVRLASHLWPFRPDLREAFLTGYRAGEGPADPDAPWMPALVALEALGTIVWSERHGDPAFARAGRRSLRACIDHDAGGVGARGPGAQGPGVPGRTLG